MVRVAAVLIAAAALVAVALAASAGGRDGSDRAASAAPSGVAASAAALTAPPPTASGDGTVLLPRGASYAWVTAEAPRLSRQIGPVALAAIDLASGRRSAGLPLAGEPPAGRPPAGWPLDVGAGAARGPAPLGAARATEPCDCATRLGDLVDRRVAAVWATTTFEVAAADALDVIDIRARYRDGIAIWLNGVEIVRRSLAPGASATALAERSHGPEWETFHVPAARGVLRDGSNVVAVQVAAAAASSAPTLDLEIVGYRGARAVRGPMVQVTGRDRAAIVFDTDLPVHGGVEIGPTPSLGRRVASGLLPRRHHRVELTGLPAGRVYYRVIVDGGAGAVHAFHTAPAPGDVVRLAVYGDVRGGHQVHSDLVAAILAEAPDAVLVTGDLVLRGSDEADWQRFFSVAGDLLAEVPYYPAIGNHDLGAAGNDARSATALVAIAPLAGAPAIAGAGDRRFYSLDIADVHVVFLDSNAYQRADQLAWLDADLAAARARGARALLAVTHDGPFSRGTHGGNEIAARDYVPVLARHRVALVLSGHDHIYQRGRAGGIDYVVTGGGGAPLYPITCGVAGRPRCAVDDGMRFAAREHHYAMLTVYPGGSSNPSWLEMCPRRPDGTAVEPCVRYDLP
jgi:acid phosphatase type 7